MSVSAKVMRERDRDPWENTFRAVELRYGDDCRECGRLLTFADRRLCRFCRKREPQ